MSNTTNIIFFHGFGSNNQTDKFTAIKHSHKQCTTVDYVAVGIDGVCDLYEDMILNSLRKYDQTILVGHSFGGYFANMFAVKYSLRALLIAPCMRPNVYIKDRMPEVNEYNFIWETNYSNDIVILIENDDENFDIETDVSLLKNAPSEFLKVYRFNGGHHRICREDVINQELDELMEKPMGFEG